MIFYNNQLMQNGRELRLFLVSNPEKFTRYEDHEAALEIQLYELVERSIEEGQDPIALIESYLGVSYNAGEGAEEIGHYLVSSEEVRMTMSTLKENWSLLDESIPEDSRLFGRVTRKEAIQVFSELSLETYLEALVQRESV